ncbi:MAG: acyltransferase [Herpetosiphon sp.]
MTFLSPDNNRVQSPAAPTASVSPRFNELEAYRGIAALLIVIFHAYQYARVGDPGRYPYQGSVVNVVLRNLEATVEWFFVLSGFLVFLGFARAAVQQDSPQSGRGFLIRRLIRILPMYYVAIIVIWTWRYTGSATEWRDLFEHLTFTHIFDRVHIFWTIGPAWSLAVEVIFYLFVVLFGLVVYRLCRSFSSVAARAYLLTGILTLLATASVLYKYWAAYIAHIPANDWPAYFGFHAKFDTFALGMLLAVLVAAINGRTLLRGIWPSIFRMVGFVLLAITFVFRNRYPLVDLYFHSLAALAFLLVLSSTVLAARGSLWERTLSWRPLQYIGAISYSLYLWHEPLMIELGKRNFLIRQGPTMFPVNALVLVLLSIIVGTLSYYLLERPFMRVQKLFTRTGEVRSRYGSAAQARSELS